MKKFLLLSALALLLTACGGSGDNTSTSSGTDSSSAPVTPTHTHTFSDAWESDAENHWHAATCGHDVVSGKAAHSENEDGFCSVCNRYLHESFTFTNQETYFDFVRDQRNMEENEIYLCRIGGGHSGHLFALEEGDPWPSMTSALSAYTFVNGVKTAFVLDGDTPDVVGNDGYIYIRIDASQLTNLEDVWFRITERHLPISSPVMGTLQYLGVCPVDRYYYGQTEDLNSSFGLTLHQNKFTYRRVAVTSDSEFGLETDFNDDVDIETKAEVFAIVNGAPVPLKTGFDSERNVLHFPANADDNYVYIVLSYVINAGTHPTAVIDGVAVHELVHGCDAAGWYYGTYSDLINDSTDFEDVDRHINGKYIVAFVPNDPTAYVYEITVSAQAPYDTPTLHVYQDVAIGDVQELLPNGLGYFDPESGNEIIIEVESPAPGSAIDVSVIEHTAA